MAEMARPDVRTALRLSKAIKVCTDPAMAAGLWCNLSICALEADEYEACIQACEQSLAVMDTPAARYHRGLALLAQGKLRRGFADYEARIMLDPGLAWARKLPRWTGGQGDRLAVVAEQGAGDTIQFLRYLPAVQSRVRNITLVVDPSLVRLAKRAFPGTTVISGWNPEPGPFVLLMSLPHVLATTSVPAPCDFHFSPKQSMERLVRVGLCWSGAAKNPRDPARSIPLRKLRCLTKTPGVEWLCLTRDVRATDAPYLGEFGMQPLTVNDYHDTAELIRQCDLVITVDTGIAHLAGSLSVPSWLLARKGVPHWPFMNRETTAEWYPSMQWFGQATAGDWEPVVDAIAVNLATAGPEHHCVDHNVKGLHIPLCG